MSSRISIRGTVVALGAAAGVAAGAVGLNITGAVGDLTPSEAQVRKPNVPHATAFTRPAPVDRAGVAQGKERADAHAAKRKAIAHRKAAKKARAAKAAKASRLAQRRASRSSGRTYSGDPRGVARSMASSRYGWGASQFTCLDSLWEKESSWDPHAHNASSGAYGIPQAMPGSKMASKGSDWQTNPATQIAWGLSYIDDSYGSPCAAWSTSQGQGWY